MSLLEVILGCCSQRYPYTWIINQLFLVDAIKNILLYQGFFIPFPVIALFPTPHAYES